MAYWITFTCEIGYWKLPFVKTLTPGNANWMYVYSGGALKSGWFGSIDRNRVARRIADVDCRVSRRGDHHARRPRRDGERNRSDRQRRDHRAITVNVMPAE